MKRRVGFALSLLALSGLFFLNVPAARAGKGSLATITGSVKDEKGNPLAGAIVSLLKDGANVVIKETKTSNDGRFSAKIAPGRYSIRGIPALAFKFGFTKGSPEAQIQADWLKNRYHAPSDDLNQPVAKEDAAKFNRILIDLAMRVANADKKPEWKPDSFFRRFATK